MGLYLLLLCVIWAVAALCSVLWKQWLAPYLFVGGAGVLLPWVLGVWLKSAIPFVWMGWMGLDPYIVLILAMMLTSAGGIGLLAKVTRLTFHWASGKAHAAK